MPFCLSAQSGIPQRFAQLAYLLLRLRVVQPAEGLFPGSFALLVLLAGNGRRAVRMALASQQPAIIAYGGAMYILEDRLKIFIDCFAKLMIVNGTCHEKPHPGALQRFDMLIILPQPQIPPHPQPVVRMVFTTVLPQRDRNRPVPERFQQKDGMRTLKKSLSPPPCGAALQSCVRRNRISSTWLPDTHTAPQSA